MKQENRMSKKEAAGKIIVIGVGGTGNNAVNRMIDAHITGVRFVGMDTDKVNLHPCRAAETLQIGSKVRGAGARPEIGERAARESEKEIGAVLKGADAVFVICGMGGGTGTGAAPVVAEIARNMGIFTIGVVTKPFRFEAKIRIFNAQDGIDKMKDNVDILVVNSNEKLLEVAPRHMTMPDALKKADELMLHVVYEIVDLMNASSSIIPDFEGVRMLEKMIFEVECVVINAEEEKKQGEKARGKLYL